MPLSADAAAASVDGIALSVRATDALASPAAAEAWFVDTPHIEASFVVVEAAAMDTMTVFVSGLAVVTLRAYL